MKIDLDMWLSDRTKPRINSLHLEAADIHVPLPQVGDFLVHNAVRFIVKSRSINYDRLPSDDLTIVSLHVEPEEEPGTFEPFYA